MIILFRGKPVGEVVGDTYKVIKKPEHFMRIFQGFGMSMEVLEQLIKLGISKIEITYLGTNGNIIYNQTVKDYLDSDMERVDKENDVQKFVSVRKNKKNSTNDDNNTKNSKYNIKGKATDLSNFIS